MDSYTGVFRNIVYVGSIGLKMKKTSWPYFGVKLRKKIAYSYLKVTYCYPNVNYSGLKVTYS